jgi:hypothetical protein
MKPHRELTLSSPVERGEDVKNVQAAANKVYRHFRIERRIRVDGEMGPQTHSACRETALLLGVRAGELRKLRNGKVTVRTQKLIRGRDRSRLERLAAGRRRDYRRRLRKRYGKDGGEKAIAIARRLIGVTEDPAGSNWGPQISKWIRYTGYSFPVYWCGCFACWCVGRAGAKVPNRIRLGYTGYITADANAHQNGLRAVSWEDARAGDIVVYSFDHIGLVESVSGDTLTAIEGNTSSTSSGSQSNGGGVFRRTRSRGDVVTIARPDY